MTITAPNPAVLDLREQVRAARAKVLQLRAELSEVRTALDLTRDELAQARIELEVLGEQEAALRRTAESEHLARCAAEALLQRPPSGGDQP
ncbi:hypothetical protein [Actinomadura rupiterrae]|uniref:hypothetical protein n=1 Tax=Actinomadura rupiterrae TaxID=559627 RepID=UPI0020A27D88|nr:hypothetical protein [Actinomadura rupiterrae]MCP2340183.1 uncharacterized coiled-coil DUF342 family protein [Actinomadura rupiterrae]